MLCIFVRFCASDNEVAITSSQSLKETWEASPVRQDKAGHPNSYRKALDGIQYLLLTQAYKPL